MSDRRIRAAEEPKLLLLLSLQQGLFLAAGAGLWVWSGRSLSELLRFGWNDVLIGLGLAAVLVGLLTALLAFPSLRARMAHEMGRSLFATERPYGWGAILLISFAAGIGEEALFRGGIQIFAGGYMPGWVAVAFATLLFTIAHPGSPAFMAFVAGISAILGTAYHLTGSLLAVMLAHALLDVCGCFLTQRELRQLDHWSDPSPSSGG